MANKKVLFANAKDLITIPSGNAWAEDITDFRIKKGCLDILKGSGAYWIGLIEQAQEEEMCLGEEMLLARLSLVGNFTAHYTNAAAPFSLSTESLDDAYLRLVGTLTANKLLKKSDDWAIVGDKELALRMEVEYLDWKDLCDGTDTGKNTVEEEG